MTDVEFYDLVAREIEFRTGKARENGFLPVRIDGAKGKVEFRVKWRKKYKDIRLVLVQGRNHNIRFIDRYEINPHNKLNTLEGEDYIAIYRDMDINSAADVQAAIIWIKKYIPKMYDELL